MFYPMRTRKNPSVRLRFLGQIRNLGVLYHQSRSCDSWGELFRVYTQRSSASCFGFVQRNSESVLRLRFAQTTIKGYKNQFNLHAIQGQLSRIEQAMVKNKENIITKTIQGTFHSLNHVVTTFCHLVSLLEISTIYNLLWLKRLIQFHETICSKAEPVLSGQSHSAFYDVLNPYFSCHIFGKTDLY